MRIRHELDPRLDIPTSDYSDVPNMDAAREIILDNYEYWRGMIGEEMPADTRITLNTSPDGMTWYLTIHYPATYAENPAYGDGHQTDIFFIKI